MREAVIVLTDLYLDPGAHPGAARRGELPGIEHAGRFGTRTHLARGWRDWLATRLGRADLAAIAPARIAGVQLGASPGTSWIATPVHLSPGLSQVHLDHRGLLRVRGAPAQALAAGFNAQLGSAGLRLDALPSGEFLLRGEALGVVPATEPARVAGGEVAAALPQGREAAALRRTAAEIEMWLHRHELNEARGRAGEPTVNALWLWGAAGSSASAQLRPQTRHWRACGEDAWLAGLWHLQGGASEELPAHFGALSEDGAGSVLALAIADELRENMQSTFLDAVRALDERFIVPALARVRGGALDGVTLVANDTALQLGRASALQLWRRSRGGLGAFA